MDTGSHQEHVLAHGESRSDQVVHRLTAREIEVLRLVAQGKNNAAIADALVLSERGVEKHINALFRKLDLTDERSVNRRVMAVLLYQAANGS